MRLLHALTSSLLLPPRAPVPACGLLDWMLADVPSKPPIETLCRPEGWDVTCRIDGLMRSYDVSLRFFCVEDCDLSTPSGTVSLVSPSPHFADEGGTWQVIDDGMSIRWRLTTTNGIIDTEQKPLLTPGADMLGTFRLVADMGPSELLSDGVLLRETGVVGGERRIGVCEASPMPLMGSN